MFVFKAKLENGTEQDLTQVWYLILSCVDTTVRSFGINDLCSLEEYINGLKDIYAPRESDAGVRYSGKVSDGYH